jgi:large repetitive protein
VQLAIFDAKPERGATHVGPIATDLAGNTGVTQSISWTLDFTAPLLSFGAILPSASSYQNVSEISISVETTEALALIAALNASSLGTSTSPFILSSLGEGPYSFSVQGIDSAGNASQTLAYDFIVDLTAPILTVTSDGTSPTKLDHRTFTLSTSETTDLACNVDQGGFAPCTTPFNLSGLADGDHEIRIEATDLAGNKSIANQVWTIDTLAPLTTASHTQNNSSIALNLFSSESGGTFYCSMDGATLQVCSATPQFSGLSVGLHTFLAQAEDIAGNRDLTGAVLQFEVTPPVSTSIDSASPQAPITNQNEITFSFSANQAQVSYVCSLDGAPHSACQSGAHYTGLSSGAHTFNVRAIDRWGNVDPTGASHNWTIDSSVPATAISSTQNGSAISFSMSSNAPNATFVCSMDGAPFTSCTSPVTYTNLSVGEHLFTAKAINSLGTTDPFGASATFTVYGAISTTITAVNPAASVTNSTSIGFVYTANQPASGYLCSLDGATASPCGSSINYTGLSEGAHQFHVKAVDLNNQSDPVGATHNWVIDSVAPAIGTVTFAVTRTTITVMWTTSEPATDQVLYGAGLVPTTSTTESTTLTTNHSVTLTDLIANTVYAIQVTGHDGAVNSYLSTIKSTRTSR